MKIVGEIELTGIKRIVINRTAIWERFPIWGSSRVPGKERTDVEIKRFSWKKTSGGPGVKAFSKNHEKSPDAMMRHVNRLLAMGFIVQENRTTKKGHMDVETVQVLAYRCWVHGDTLNIVRKDLP